MFKDWRWNAHWLRKVASVAYSLCLVFLWLALGIAASRPHPLLQGKPEDLWKWALERKEVGPWSTEVIPIVLLPPSDYLFYSDTADPSHPWRGVIFIGVHEREVLAAFPDVLARNLQQPGLSAEQLGALLQRNVTNVEMARSEATARISELAGSPEVMRRFIKACQDHLVAQLKGETRDKAIQYRVYAEESLADWLARYGRYWLTVTFEYIFFTGLSTLFWAPLISQRLLRYLPILWGLLPVAVALPHTFGYCWIASAMIESPGQGVLYPDLLSACFSLFRLAPELDGRIIALLPQPLEFLNQPVINPGLFLFAITGPLGSFVMGAAIWGVAFALRSYLVKRKEDLLPTENRRFPSS